MNAEIAAAVALLQAGELVAFPTETVYGLGADAANPEAVARIFAAKERPADHPLIVHLGDVEHLGRWARDIPPAAQQLAAAFWPGPLTMILPRATAVPLAVTGGQDTVGIRIPSHPLALELLRAFAARGGGGHGMGGIAAPSANRFGRISPTTAAHVRDELGPAVALVLDGGPCTVGIESTIVDLSRPDRPPRLLRPGHITPAQIAAVIGAEPELPSGGSRPNDVPRVSGSLDGHYAPRTAMRLVPLAQLAALSADLRARGVRCGVLVRGELAVPAAATLRRLPDTPDGFAHGLYTALRELDLSGGDLILAAAVPGDEPAWAAVADRLRRSAHGAGCQST